MPPLARHHKFREGLACSGSNLAILQRWREGFGIAGVAESQCSKGIPIGWNFKYLTGFLHIETGHLMHEEPSRCGFNGEKGGCSAEVVGSVAVWSVVLRERELGNGERKNRRILGPVHVELHENAKRFGKVFFVVFRGDQISPGLFVVA